MTAAAHYAAVKARLVSGAISVEGVARTDSQGRYVLGRYVILTGGAAEELFGDRQGKRHVADDNAEYDYHLRHVATSVEDVLDLIDATNELLTDWVPTISGRRCSAMIYPPSQNPDIQVETSVRPPLFYADTEWTLRSTFTSGS